MKQLILSVGISLLASFALAQEAPNMNQNQGPREQFNQQSGQDHRAQVEAIANQQGIDLSTQEGRHQMAQYLRESGQENLLPPRRNSRQGGQQGQGQNDQQMGQGRGGSGGGRGCDKPPRGPRGGGQQGGQPGGQGGPQPNNS